MGGYALLLEEKGRGFSKEDARLCSDVFGQSGDATWLARTMVQEFTAAYYMNALSGFAQTDQVSELVSSDWVHLDASRIAKKRIEVIHLTSGGQYAVCPPQVGEDFGASATPSHVLPIVNENVQKANQGKERS